MNIDRDRQDVAAASEPTDWRRSLRAFAGILCMGTVSVFSIALIAALPAGPSAPTAWASVVSDWSLASTAHVAWSAPLLIATAGILATLSNTTLGNDEGLRRALTFAAHIMAAGAALWVMTAMISMLVPAPPEVWAARQQLWGVILVAGPVAIGAGVAAGRFPRIGPEVRLSSGKRNLRDLDAQLGEMRRRAMTEWSMLQARSVAWAPPIAVGVSCAISLVVLISAQGVTEPRIFAAWVTSVIVLLCFWAVPIGLLRVLWTQPLGALWRRDKLAARRRPTALGSACLILLTAWASAALASCVAVIVLILSDPGPYGLSDRLAYAAVVGGGLIALTVAVMLHHRGRNAWATVGYLRRARFRDGYLAQVKQARAELERRRREARSRALVPRIWDAFRRQRG